MVVPVLAPQVDTVRGVFPGIKQGEVWYDWYSQTAVDAEPGVNTTIAAPLGHIPVFLRGGSVIPMQEPALTTRDARRTPWSLLTSLGSNGTAELYLDDGESLHPNATLSVMFHATKNTLRTMARGDWQEANTLSQVTVLGVSSEPGSVTFNGKSVPASSVQYNSTAKVLSVRDLHSLTADGALSKNWILEW